MKAPKSFIRDLELIRPGLFPVWNEYLQRFQIFWRDRRTGLTRVIMTVENEDGTFRPLDIRTIIWLSQNVAWDLLDKYPSPQDMYSYLKEAKIKRKLSQEKLREDYRKWINKELRTLWRAAIENARRNIYWLPEKKDKKIYIIN
jgi:hypothetical protein